MTFDSLLCFCIATNSLLLVYVHNNVQLYYLICHGVFSIAMITKYIMHLVHHLYQIEATLFISDVIFAAHDHYNLCYG